MRESIFRGKRLDNGEWIEGDLRQDPDLETAYINGWDYSTADYALQREPFEHQVDPLTVCQYTGLNDKNGRQIFDGDILSTTNSNSRIWYIDYKSASFRANQSNADFDCVLGEFMRYSEVEVIGNIHDNPELLEENK